MVNQEIPMWRVSSFVLATGGMLASDLNDLVGAHEFGHQIGTLGDEYTEFGLEYVGQSLLRSNLTGFSQFDMVPRSEEHTSELQSLMRISYAVFCLKKKTHLQDMQYNK